MFLTQDFITLLGFVNILVIIYAIFYAWRFISLTREDSARKPWEYLMYAVGILLFLQTIRYTKWEFSEILYQILLLVLTTLLLMVFVIQDYHMKKENFEVLTRKEMIPIEKKIEQVEKE